MSLGRTLAVALSGLEGTPIRVEADLSPGLPSVTITGLPDAACRQSAERIRSAAANSGLPIPQRRITVNLSPASLPKNGSGFDLPIAVAVLVAAGLVPDAAVEHVLHLGELGLDGSIRPVRGILPMVVTAATHGVRTVVVPSDNAAEAALVPDVRVIAVEQLSRLVASAQAGYPADPSEGPEVGRLPDPIGVTGPPGHDLAEVVGQGEARVALEIAAAGGHHVFLVGPPGAGKTMLAECLPGLLPQLTPEESLEVTAIHSVLGTLPAETLVRHPPFVAPHHGASMAALVGGGSGFARPGLISQAHRGVLFLDEAPEFRSSALQALRQPMESGQVVISRAQACLTFPARFQLVLAANPCPCGRSHGKGHDCACSPSARRQYVARLAGPLLDRVDLQLAVPPVTLAALAGPRGESSNWVAQRVGQARELQAIRLRDSPWTRNADVPGDRLRRPPLRLPTATTVDIDRAIERGLLTLRGYDRVLRLAWTSCDLREGGLPNRDDVGRALSLRAHAGVAA